MSAPGRSCPLAYRYGPAALAKCPPQVVETLYVVGGLYGNLPALETVQAMVAQEPGPVTLCFNGDFNWFNVDDAGFVEINHAVLKHDAIQGNVEAELLTPEDDAGCGCAYPESVDAGVVERSNAIHARLKSMAHHHPQILDRLRSLPLFRRYRVGNCVIGVVHGDAESLAGWRFDIGALDDPASQDWLGTAFAQAEVDVFASTHTCLPALRQFTVGGKRKLIANNGAAGMPNFAGERSGLITRIGLAPGPYAASYGAHFGEIYIDALPVRYDHATWENVFITNWPIGSPAHISYYNRIDHGPSFAIDRARPPEGVRA